jgi:ubiquinone/menaquinone biosynthesis C-methylase UbiE
VTESSRVCPASHAGWLATPMRRLVHSPTRILAGMVEPGQTAADLGCGPGFFTLPLARMVGAEGRVIAVDLQPMMLDIVQSRADRAGLTQRIALQACAVDDLRLEGWGRVDFALAFAIVHEVPDARWFFAQVAGVLEEGARLLLVEPIGHVGGDAFARTLEIASGAGLRVTSIPRVALSRAALLVRG